MRVAPLVSNIHHFALDDGPGIRTTIFFKGCRLSCPWCHNPESISPLQEIAFHPERCIGCNDCEAACVAHAIDGTSPQKIIRDNCTRCGKCADACPAKSFDVVGKEYAIVDLLEIALRDRLFYETSGGGVTLSGGEPTLHLDYIGRLAQSLKEQNIHVALQTSGLFDLDEARRKLLCSIDLIYFDIKFLDSDLHQQWTGKDNETILKNFTSLLQERGDSVMPRVPLIPGITATQENLSGIARFLRTAGCEQYQLLSYNSGGTGKGPALGLTTSDTIRSIQYNPEEDHGFRTYFSRCFEGTTGSSVAIQ